MYGEQYGEYTHWCWGGGGEGKRLNKHATIYTINIHKFYLIQFSVESHTRLHLRYKVNWDLQKLFT